MRRQIEFTLNGKAVGIEADETAPLLDLLRNQLAILSPRFGCGAEQCGACSVLINGEDKPSCAIEIATIVGKRIETVEGMGTPERPHPLQAAFIEKQAGQCGYCLSGILIGAKALLDRKANPTRKEIAASLSWHLCRCGAHNRILDAVELAAQRMRDGASA